MYNFFYVVGAFLVPYFLFMFLCAMPMMFLEMTVSQYSNLGPGRVWVCCPLFKGFIVLNKFYFIIHLHIHLTFAIFILINQIYKTSSIIIGMHYRLHYNWIILVVGFVLFCCFFWLNFSVIEISKVIMIRIKSKLIYNSSLRSRNVT